ncbi:MAG: hypothetical protein M1839_001678 [Geoglossum umbratile]|nr:MAG: hypothetical protein M1839_001678 [Geoglossum umbratile]
MTSSHHYRSHTSTFKCLGLRSIDELYDWYRSDLFKPFWVKFYNGYLRPARSHSADSSRGPALPRIILSIELGEQFGKQRYSAETIDTPHWRKDEWYAYLLFKVTNVNMFNSQGLFYEINEPEIKVFYSKVYVSILNLIRDTGKTNQGSIIPIELPTPVPITEGPVTEGITVIWGNANDQNHGYRLNAPDTDNQYTLDHPFALPTVAAIRNRIRTYFDLSGFSLEIARLFLKERDSDTGYHIVQLTNDIWRRLRAALPGSRGHIYLIVETRKTTGEGLGYEPEDSLLDLLDTDEILDSEPTIADRFITETLDFTGTDDPMYAAMVAERGDREFSLAHRSCQYDTLFRIASLTNPGNPNADVVWENESAVRLDTEAANVQSVLWRKQLELLGNADGSNQLNHLEQAAAAGTLQFQDITSEEKSIFEDQEKWLDNTKLQREDEEEAYSGLGITDRERPQIAGMNRRTILKFWQVTAIWALYKFHTGWLKGGVLADAVGLGKTIVALGLLQFKYNLRMKANTVRERTRRHGVPKPTMVVVPPTLLHQWVEMIREHLPDFIVFIYYGNYPDTSQDQTKRFIDGCLHKRGFKDDERIAKAIILTTYKTMARRHGPALLSKTRKAKINLADTEQVAELNSQWTVPELAWDRDLQGCIGHLILDEAHAIKGGYASNAYIALKWLNAEYTTCLTATVMPNTSADFGGILGLLQHQNIWNDDYLGRLGVNRDFNPFSEGSGEGELKWLRCSQEALRKFVLSKDIDLVTKGHRLSMIMELCVIKRGYGSRIPFGPLGRRIGDSMKPMQVRTIELQYTADEISQYRPLHNFAINTLVKTIDVNGKKTVVFDMKQWRALKHYSTWLGFEHLLKYHVGELQEFRTNPAFSLRKLADVACEANSLTRPGESLNELLEWFAHGSPKLRWMCWALAELVVKRKEKMLIWVQFPWQQELLYLFIKEVGIDVQRYHSGLSDRQRQEHIKAFHKHQSRTMVLICSYSINSCGLNLHGYCRNVMIFEPAPSSPIEFQAIGRVYRVGQQHTVRVLRLYLQDSWNEWEEGNGLVKELPALMAELNMNIFGVESDPNDEAGISLGDRDIGIRRYVVFDNRLVPAEERPDIDALSPEDLVQTISRMLKDQRSFRSKVRKEIK